MDDVYKKFEECNPNKKRKNVDCILWFDYWYT